MKDGDVILVLVIAAAIGFFCGWLYAHSTIAAECRKLGGFYVGKSTFKCEEIRND